MELKFNSVEEVLEFANRVNDHRNGLDPVRILRMIGDIEKGLNYTGSRTPAKISAIKLYREIFGTGLKHAKDAIESLPEFQAPRYYCGPVDPQTDDRPDMSLDHTYEG